MLIISHSVDNPTYCNRCGHPLDVWDIEQNLNIHKERLGYGTVHDGDSVDLHLCCSCFDKLVAECKINPITERDA